jgi:murein DD-endopeptidase MepM/ murein hydrolase activator NlpD
MIKKPAVKIAVLATLMLLTNSGRAAPFQVVDLNIGEAQDVGLADGTRVRAKLLSVQESRDTPRQAVRQARVEVELNGQPVVLTSATYNLPVTAAGVQVDCPITRGYIAKSFSGVAGFLQNSDQPGADRSVKQNVWGLLKDARLRIWPAGSPWIEPDTFRYPLRQRWFASHTQMANEPTFVDGGEDPAAKTIYYHYGLDFGGAEGMVDVVAATAGLVVSSGNDILPGHEGTPAAPRYDVVYLRDERGWYYRYSHLQTIDSSVRPGARVAIGQKIGVLGKEGGSGGWSHLHFDISSRQASGLWGIVDGYAFVWEAYLREFSPQIIAVARPHHLICAGEKIMLDGSKSWAASQRLTRFEWTFTDGTTAEGPTVERTYTEPGFYSEVLKVTDEDGNVDYDFAVVDVLSKSASPDHLPPTIHPTFAPTMDIRAGDPVTFQVRSFGTTFGNETWDFGDGTAKVDVKSDGNVEALARHGYAVTEHRFAQPGHYVVRVERKNQRGERAVGHLHLRVQAR